MSRASRKKARRAGRPHDPNAKRHQTTADGQGRGIDHGTAQTVANRKALLGRDVRGADSQFPLDALVELGLIDAEMRDEGLRFAVLAWWLYGPPNASCARLYERMLTGGGLGDDLAPRLAGDLDDPDAAQKELDRIRSNKARFERMVRALGASSEGELERIVIGGAARVFRRPLALPTRGTMYEAVRNAAQMLERPRFLPDERGNPGRGAADFQAMARLVAGLSRLVALRSAEDRHWRRRRQTQATPVGEGS